MPNLLTIHEGSTHTPIKVKEASNLLSVLQENQFLIAAPCGGNGTCGKCKVNVLENIESPESKKEVLACQYEINNNQSIYIPHPEQVKILSESYFPTLSIQYNEVQHPDYGIAVDVGTTTIVVFLEDLKSHKNIATASFLNPQKGYGADVISRIQYAMEPDGLSTLQNILLLELSKTIKRLCRQNQIDELSISGISLAGNTSMLHILRGTDPSSLASYPFTPVFTDHISISESDLGLNINPKATVHFLPSLSAYVGADIMSGIAASEMPDEEEYALFLDIGTNGEMAVGNKNKILCCATAAGPAFEGAKISCGLGGVEGAIHTYSNEGYETIGNTDPTGLCGSGLIDLIAHLLQSNQLDPSGYLESSLPFLADFGLSLTPQDIREVQLAKGAIAAGIETLVKKADIGMHQIAKVYLAGGFGYAIHPKSAAEIGLFPPELVPKIIRAGNTAGLGARLFLHSNDFVERIKRIASHADHFDLSMDMGFNESFVMNMGFPDHSDVQ